MAGNNGNGVHASPCPKLVAAVVVQARHGEQIEAIDRAQSEHNRRQNHSLETLAEEARAAKIHLRDLRWGLGALMLVSGSGHPAVAAVWRLLGL